MAKNSGLQMSSEDVKAIAEVVTAVGSPVDSMADAKIVSVIMENVIPSGDKVKSDMFGSRDKEMRGSSDVVVSKTEVMEEVMHAIEESIRVFLHEACKLGEHVGSACVSVSPCVGAH